MATHSGSILLISAELLLLDGAGEITAGCITEQMQTAFLPSNVRKLVPAFVNQQIFLLFAKAIFKFIAFNCCF